MVTEEFKTNMKNIVNKYKHNQNHLNIVFETWIDVYNWAFENNEVKICKGINTNDIETLKASAEKSDLRLVLTLLKMAEIDYEIKSNDDGLIDIYIN